MTDPSSTGPTSSTLTSRSEPTSNSATPRVKQSVWLDGLHIWSLFNLAVTQTFYSRLVGQPEYSADPHVTPDGVLWVGIWLTLVLPLIVSAPVWIAGRKFPQSREVIRTVLILIFSTLLLMQTFHSGMMPDLLIAPAALTGSVVFVWLYQKFQAVRQFVTCSALGIVLTPLILYSEFWGSEENSVFRLERDSTRPRVPVVLVVFDELSEPSLLAPDQSIDKTRYPNFSQLSQDTTWYRNACATASLTMRALPSILTGQLPTFSENVTPKTYPQNLFESLVAGAGYEFVAFEPVTIVAPREAKPRASSTRQSLTQAAEILNVLSRVYSFDVVPSDFHSTLPEIPRTWFGLNHLVPADRTARRGRFRYGWTQNRDQQWEHFLSCIDGTHEGVLYFGHFLLPHAPWCFFPSGQRYANDTFDLKRGCLEESGAITDELGHIQSQQRYLLQLMYLDHALGQLIAQLKAQGIYDECLLIVTADHGVSFRLNFHRRDFYLNNASDICRIPLFVKLPHQTQGSSRDEIVQSTDILPTIFDTIGLRPHRAMHGLPLSDPRIQDRQEATIVVRAESLQIPEADLKKSDLPELIRKRFGPGTDPWDLYRIGPHSDWLGQSLEKFQRNTRTSRDVECLVSMSQAHDAAHPEYFIEGRLIGTAPETPAELVVAVDGVICATTRTYTQFGYQDRWTAMLPDWSYPRPDLSPQIFVLEADQSLTPCQIQWIHRPDMGEEVP